MGQAADPSSLSSHTNPAATAASGQDHPVSERAARLTALAVKTALGVDKDAVIYEGKIKTLERLLDGSDFTEVEVRGFTEEAIKALDSFGLRNAGGVLCATLKARIEERREALAEQRREQEAMARTVAALRAEAEQERIDLGLDEDEAPFESPEELVAAAEAEDSQ